MTSLNLSWGTSLCLEEHPFYEQNTWCLFLLIYCPPLVLIVQIHWLQKYSMHICTVGTTLGVYIIESFLCLYLALNFITQPVLLYGMYQFCLSSVQPIPSSSRGVHCLLTLLILYFCSIVCCCCSSWWFSWLCITCRWISYTWFNIHSTWWHFQS